MTGRGGQRACGGALALTTAPTLAVAFRKACTAAVMLALMAVMLTSPVVVLLIADVSSGSVELSPAAASARLHGGCMAGGRWGRGRRVRHGWGRAAVAAEGPIWLLLLWVLPGS